MTDTAVHVFNVLNLRFFHKKCIKYTILGRLEVSNIPFNKDLT